MTEMEVKEATPTASQKAPDEQRRSRKHAMYQQHKARKVAERAESPLFDNNTTQLQLTKSRSESPLFSSSSKRSISARRKEIIQKRSHRKKVEEPVEAAAVKKESQKLLDSSWLNASMEESIDDDDNDDDDDDVEAVDKYVPMEEERPPEPDISNVHLDTNASLGESIMERADKVETHKQVRVRKAPTFGTTNKQRSLDTTNSILEHPPEPLMVDPSKVDLDSNDASFEKPMERSDHVETNINLEGGVFEESMNDNVGDGIMDQQCPPHSDEAMGEDLLGDVVVVDVTTDKRPPPMSDEANNENVKDRGEGFTGQNGVVVGDEATDNRPLLPNEANKHLGERVESSMGEKEFFVGGEVTDNRPLRSNEANVQLGQHEESMGEDVGGAVVTEKRTPLSDEAEKDFGEREESVVEDGGGEITDKLPSPSDEANVELGQRDESMGENIVGGVAMDKRPPLSDEAEKDFGEREEESMGREEFIGENVNKVPPLFEKCWDTRSILEHPPERVIDPSWDTSKLHFESKTEECYTFKDMKMEVEDMFSFDLNLSGIDMVDTESWAKTDMTFPSVPHVDNEQEVLMQGSAKDVTNKVISVKDEGMEPTLANDIFAEDSFETFEPALVEAVFLMKGAGGEKQVDTSMDVNVGCCYSFNAVFPPSKDDKALLTSDQTNTALKDDEELLAFGQMRSDVDRPIVSEADKMLNQVAKQKRIDQYKERDDDPTSDNGEDDADSDEEDFANEEEIQYVAAENEKDENADSDDEYFAKEQESHYISADSSEEFEVAAQITANSIAVPEDVGGLVQADQYLTFNPTASAALGANGKSNLVGSLATTSEGSMHHENIELIHTKSSTSSDKADSTLMDYSVASSTALYVQGLLTSAMTCVNNEGTGTLATIRGIAAAPPPPPPVGSPTPKSSKNLRAKSTPILKIPPPPPEKLKKWQEEKLRPMKHRQSAAKAKAALAVRNYGQEQIAESDGSTAFVTSYSTLQDEIEMALSESLVHENSMKESNVDKEEARSDTLTEAAPIQMLNVTTPRATTGTDSFIDSPPHVTRTVLEDISLVAKDGVWKDDDNLKVARSLSIEKVVPADKAPSNKSFSPSKLKKSSIPDSKMAERLALACYSAAQKFEENYPDVDGDDSSEATPAPAEYLNHEVDPPEKPVRSYFCAPDMLTASICEPFETEVVNDDDDLLHHVPSQVKGWASLDKAPDEQIGPPSIYENSFDDTHHAGLELVGGAFSTWRNSDYAYAEPEASVAEINQGSLLDNVVDASGVAVGSKPKETAAQIPIDDAEPSEEAQLLSWLEKDVLSLPSKTGTEEAVTESDPKVNADGGAALARSKLEALLEVDEILNSLCKYTSENIVMAKSPEDSLSDAVDVPPRLHPFSIPVNVSKRPNCSILAANFVSFLNRTSLLSGIESPFKDENPFIFDIVTASLSGLDFSKTESVRAASAMQELVFKHELGDVVGIVRFFFQACGAPCREVDTQERAHLEKAGDKEVDTETTKAPAESVPTSLLYQVPTESPCPFETAVWNMPSIVAIALGFLGDPVVVCRMKLVNSFCNRLIEENEHVIMRDAVRLGGISMHIRPAFWMWITLEKCGRYRPRVEQRDDATTDEGRKEATTLKESCQEGNKSSEDDDAGGPLEYQSKGITILLPELEKRGREGKWHHVIQRDVTRAFGNMPPHKTGARLRTDSIVRALVTWGRGRLIQRGVKGGGVAPPTPTIGAFQKHKSKLRPATGPPPWERGDGDADDNNSYKGPTETVTQWSGISPVPSFSSSAGGHSGPGESVSMVQKLALANSVATALERERKPIRVKNSRAIEELALSGNTLTNEMKAGLQNQLGYILHALAAAHEDVGYCQGMDYVVAHLLRVLQDTVRYHSVRGTLCSVIGAQPEIPAADSDEQSLSTQIDQAIDSSLVVEETVFRVMDTFFTTYNLRHMYWPELRCLKTCCRVFERLIQLKLPVLADHFAYHELNVGLFALGWFQTLFLYLPSMPSATVCHMWDIWLVERSFKIFFRVGTAILFLSQPILLNHELEGMMTYLNTFPDATLLNPDILIACALQIKVTNRILMEIEQEVTGGF